MTGRAQVSELVGTDPSDQIQILGGILLLGTLTIAPAGDTILQILMTEKTNSVIGKLFRKFVRYILTIHRFFVFVR